MQTLDHQVPEMTVVVMIIIRFITTYHDSSLLILYILFETATHYLYTYSLSIIAIMEILDSGEDG